MERFLKKFIFRFAMEEPIWTDEILQQRTRDMRTKARVIDYTSLGVGAMAFLTRYLGFQEGKNFADKYSEIFTNTFHQGIKENPTISKELSEKLNGMFYESWSIYQELQPLDYGNMIILALGTALAFNAVATVLSMNPPMLQILRRLSQGFLPKKLKGNELKTLKKLAEKFHDPRAYLEIELSKYLLKNEYDGLLQTMQKYAEIRNSFRLSTTIAEKIFSPPVILKEVLLAYVHPTVSNNIDMSLGLTRVGFPSSAIHFIERCKKSDPNHTAEWLLMSALWYRSLGKQEKAQQKFKNALEILLQQGAHFSSLGESRNEVYEWGASPFLKNSYIFKKGSNPQRLTLEMKIAEIHREAYREKNGKYAFIPIEEPLSFLDPDMLVTRRIKGKTLAKIAESHPHQDVIAEYRKAMVTLAELAAWSTPVYKEQQLSSPMYDHESEFRRRVIQRWGSSQFTDSYSREISKIKKLADKLSPVLAHRDAADNNLLANGYVIDFETAGLADPTLDVATAVNNPRLTFDDQEELFQVYFNELRAASGKVYQHKLMHELFRRNREFNAICQAAANSTKNNHEDREKARQQAQQVKSLLQQRDPALASLFAEYLSASPCLS